MSIGITIAIIILLALLIACIGIWNINTDTPIDYDLYGMDAEEYLKKQVGQEYYNKHYKE
jgi:hypothetical protein